MRYQVIIPKAVQKQLKSIRSEIRQRIDLKLLQLANNPRPEGVKKLQGHDNQYRVRVGEYRIRYAIEDEKLIVILIRVAHRRDVYRD